MRCFRPSAKHSATVNGPTVKLPTVQAAEVYCVASGNVTSFSPPSAPPAPPPRASAPFEETEYQHLSSKLMQMLHSLRSIGAHHQLELPLVVVCGNQSAGKSSLIEALCGVPLPRSDGTCTRCPLEVRMTTAPISSAAAATAASHGSLGGDRPGWSCAIKLRREYDVQGNKLTTAEEALFQGGIGSKRDVERLLRTAQERLLALDAITSAAAKGGATQAQPSPSGQGTVGGSEYGLHAPPAPGRANGGPSVGFSRNVLVLEISGAPVDLVLVDLPGIIHSVERPDDLHFRDVVLDLVRSYIHRESAVIVSVISCKEDIDTQSILGIAREADPRGTRTVGVLTKPDQIEPACHRQWLDVLQGRRYPLALGYYMVRNPGQQQLLDGIRSEDARRAESSFFSSTPPWASMAHAEGSRLGTVALRNSLSQVLVELTRQALPGLQAEATSRLHMVECQLDKLPPPPPAAADDPRRALLVMADMAVSAVRRQLLAGGAEKAFYQRLLALAREFKVAIYATKPKYVVGSAHQDLASYAFTCITDGDQETMHEADTASRLRSGFVLSLVAVPPPPSSSSRPAEPRTSGEQRALAAGTALTLEDVRLVIEQHRGLELPGFSPYSAVQALIARTTSAWSEAVETLLERSVDAVSAVVVDATLDIFGRFPEAYRLSRSSAQALVQQLRLTCLAQVRGLVQMEQSNAFTMNRTDFESTTADVLQQLREAYHTRHLGPPAAATPPKTSGSTPPGKGTTASGGNRAAALRSGSSSYGLTPALRRSIGGGGGDDDGNGAGGGTMSWLSHDVSDEQILGMMAVSLTYFVVSSRRIVDYVPLHVMHYLVGQLAEQLKGTLVDALMAGASEGGRGEGRDYGARWMLREEAGDAAQRAELRAQRDLLENVLTSLRY